MYLKYLAKYWLGLFALLLQGFVCGQALDVYRGPMIAAAKQPLIWWLDNRVGSDSDLVSANMQLAAIANHLRENLSRMPQETPLGFVTWGEDGSLQRLSVKPLGLEDHRARIDSLLSSIELHFAGEIPVSTLFFKDQLAQLSGAALSDQRTRANLCIPRVQSVVFSYSVETDIKAADMESGQVNVARVSWDQGVGLTPFYWMQAIDASLGRAVIASKQTHPEINEPKINHAVYFSWFAPSPSASWRGNLKRYGLSEHNDKPIILDADFRVAVDSGLESTSIKQRARSWWTDPALGGDGPGVKHGGLADRLQPEHTYSYLGDYHVPSSHGWASVPESPVLVKPGNRLDPSLLSDPNFLKTWSDRFPNMPRAVFENAINWLVGDHESHRMGVTLRSGMQILNTTSHTDGPIPSFLFASTHMGFAHLFDIRPADHAIKNRQNKKLEVFRFMPQELLPTIPEHYRQFSKPSIDDSFSYGLGSPWTPWAVDDKTRIYSGMGRGGSNLYSLEFDFSGSSDKQIKPRLLFVIKGAKQAPAGSPFAQMGQTWSQPTLAHMRIDGVKRAVLVFGGGYDAVRYDTAFGQTQIGNQIFIVDAMTGYLYWTASANYTDRTERVGQQATQYSHVPKMQYSIASNMRVLDTNNDGLTDLLYVGDLGGQLWRIQFDPNLDINVPNAARVSLILKAGHGWRPAQASDRRFFVAPSVSRTQDALYAIAIASGNPANMFDRTVQHGLFVVYDQPVAGNDATDSNVLTPCDLAAHPASRAGLGCASEHATRGWFFMFDRQLGERVTDPAYVFDHTLFMSTYLPPRGNNTCEINSGSSRLYGLNIRATQYDQPNAYFTRYELVEKPQDVFIQLDYASPFGQGVSFVTEIHENGRPQLGIAQPLGPLIDFSVADDRVYKTRWLEHIHE